MLKEKSLFYDNDSDKLQKMVDNFVSDDFKVGDTYQWDENESIVITDVDRYAKSCRVGRVAEMCQVCT